MTANATETIAEHVVGCLRAADYVAVTERYAPDALLDVNLPASRLQLQGPAAIRQYFAEQTASLVNLRCTQLRALVSETAVSVESECRYDGPDGECLWRCIDIMRVVADEIVEHTQYGTGRWTPTDIIRQATDAPIVRW